MFPLHYGENSCCFYCKKISEVELEDYPKRTGIFTKEGIVHRCAWHAQFKCSRCGDFHHFSWLYWCPQTNELICGSCNKPSLTPVKFWDKTYSYTFQCEKCNEPHYDLLYAEYCGIHPWQQAVELQIENLTTHSRKKARVISILNTKNPWNQMWKPKKIRQGSAINLEEALQIPNNIMPIREKMSSLILHSNLIEEEEIKTEDSRIKWEKNSKIWIRHYDKTKDKDEGDINRQLLIDPQLWKQIGDVKGLKILDAGCGNGYLSRQLARKGAEVVGIDLSKKFVEYCVNKESQELLGCQFFQASLTDLSFLEDETFDLIISNVVLVDVIEYQEAFKEMSRILKLKGRFVWSNLHPIFGRIGQVTYRLPFDTKRNEEKLFTLIDRYFDSGGHLVSWGEMSPLWQMDRTLSEYSKALKDAGFVIREIVEPKPSTKTIQENPQMLAFDHDRFPLFIIYDCLKL